MPTVAEYGTTGKAPNEDEDVALVQAGNPGVAGAPYPRGCQ